MNSKRNRTVCVWSVQWAIYILLSMSFGCHCRSEDGKYGNLNSTRAEPKHFHCHSMSFLFRFLCFAQFPLQTVKMANYRITQCNHNSGATAANFPPFFCPVLEEHAQHKRIPMPKRNCSHSQRYHHGCWRYLYVYDVYINVIIILCIMLTHGCHCYSIV